MSLLGGVWKFGRDVGSGTNGLYGLMVRQVYREWNAYGLRKDLTQSQELPQARLPIVVRELQESDITALFKGPGERIGRRARLEIAHRMNFLVERVPTPYVAVDTINNKPCFLQWLITSDSNDAVQRYFRGRFPVLKNDEALLEYAYTPAAYRGNGIMPAAMALIAGKARERQCRYVMTFVLRENAAALKGCAKAGFAPYTLRRDRHFLFRFIRIREFIPVAHAMSSEVAQEPMKIAENS